MLGKRQHTNSSDEKPNEKRRAHGNDEVLTWPSWVMEANQGKPLKTRTFKPIEVFTPKKQSTDGTPKRGEIRVLRIYNRFSKVDPELKKWPTVPDYERYNVCKNNKYQELSPMKLGPIYDENNELYGNNLEDAWQCSKVFSSQVQNCTLESMEWLNNWQEWSRRGRFSNEARRHRKLNREDRTLFSYYMGEQLNYVEARKRMYCRWYHQTVVDTDAYKDLRARHMAGTNLLLLEYDGLDRNNPAHNIDLDRESLQTFIDDPQRPFGHALVLACILLDLPLWEETKAKSIP